MTQRAEDADATRRVLLIAAASLATLNTFAPLPPISDESPTPTASRDATTSTHPGNGASAEEFMLYL